MDKGAIFDSIIKETVIAALGEETIQDQGRLNQLAFGAIRLHGLSALKIAADMCNEPVNICEMAGHQLNAHMDRSGLDPNSAGSYSNLESIGFSRLRLADSFLPLCLALLAGNKKISDGFRCSASGEALMEWLCIDQKGSLSAKKLEFQSAQEFKEGLHEFVLKRAPVRNGSVDEGHSDLVIALSVIYMQGIIESGYDIDSASHLFQKRNKWLLSSLGFNNNVSTVYSKHLVSRALFPYPVESWPDSIGVEDMLGVETYHVMNMDCYDQCLNWIDTPLTLFEHSMFSGHEDEIEEKSLKINAFNSYFEKLSSMGLDSRRLFTPGVEFLIKHYSNEYTHTLERNAKHLLSVSYDDGENIDPSHRYVINLLERDDDDSYVLMKKSIEWLASQHIDDKQFSKIASRIVAINKTSFNNAAQSVLSDPERKCLMERIIPLLEKPALHIKHMNRLERRAALSEDLKL